MKLKILLFFIIIISSSCTNRYKILFTSNREGVFSLYTMKASGTGVKRVTKDNKNYEYAKLSPNGQKILFSSNRHGGAAEIYIMNADGTDPQKLTNMNRDSWNACFSPNGKKILFHAGTAQNWHLFIMNADGSKLRSIGHKEASEYGAT